jgi:hypothetical protein
MQAHWIVSTRGGSGCALLSFGNNSVQNISFTHTVLQTMKRGDFRHVARYKQLEKK